MPKRMSRRRALASSSVLAAVSGVALVAASPSTANPAKGFGPGQIPHVYATSANPATRAAAEGTDAGGDSLELADQAQQYAAARTAPSGHVPAAAWAAAFAAAQRLPAAGGTWSELSNAPFDGEPNDFRDPVWSNFGAGEQIVSGRATALAVSPHGILYAGTADGGVWRSTNGGLTWEPTFDQMPTTSIGAVATTGEWVWAGTGEANMNSDSYRGQGVFASNDTGKTWRKVGGGEIDGHQIFRLTFDGVGQVYAATTAGLFRHAASIDGTPWQRVLAPDPNPTNAPYSGNYISDVAVKPGTAGKVVVAAAGWRGGSDYNGLYLSTDGGRSFRKVANPAGVSTADMGRTTLAYSADGARLYALIQSPKRLAAGDASLLTGVFVSRTGDVAGAWSRIADENKLADSGSALKNMPGYHVGIQAWYNQALAVDPKNHDHLYVSLEEVFETRDGGAHFQTIAPYWNFGLACNPNCPPSTHPDQHALLISGDRVFIANDGGVYKRGTWVTGYGQWGDLNNTLHTLQFYAVGAGRMGAGTAYYGGLQDNGTFLEFPSHREAEVAGGDGGDVIVDPANASHMLGEYTEMALYKSWDGGHDYTTISPACAWNPDFAGCDPNARFIAPMEQDAKNANHWVVGGEYVWETTKGWQTNCSSTACDFRNVHDTGPGNVVTALGVSGKTIYAGWVAGGGNPGPAFDSGIDTNAGGSWHRIYAANLPKRFPNALTVDPANPNHVFAVYNGFSRRFVNGGGTGVIFESWNGGRSWTDRTGNLPDAPGDDAVVVDGHLVLATDVGVFVTAAEGSATWSRLGSNLPHASANDLLLGADGHAVTVATHGRGLWQIRL